MKNKVQRYEAAGRVMAETASHIGLGPICFSDWTNVMAGIAIYDDISEISPDKCVDPEKLLLELNLDPYDQDLRTQASGLIEASRLADTTDNLDTHFFLRELEAIHTVRLLKGVNYETRDQYPQIWRKLERVAVAGTFLDDVMDAKEDAKRLPQFSARELAYSGLLRFLKESQSIDRSTWSSLIKSCLFHDPKRQFSKPFIMVGSLLSVSTIR